MKVAFPDLDSQLARQDHMYICHESASSKKTFFKCQTYKPLTHSNPVTPPFNFIVERKNPERNPFNKPETLIDLDKMFTIENVIFARTCLTTNRTDICKGLYSQIISSCAKSSVLEKALEVDELVKLNSFCSMRKITNLP